MIGAVPYAHPLTSPNCPGSPLPLPGSGTFSIAGVERSVNEGEDAVFTITRRGAPGPCRRVRLRVSGHDKVMTRLTQRLQEFDMTFPPGVTTRTLRLTTEQDNRNEGDGEIRVTIVGSAGYPRSAAVRVRDDDIPEVTLHAVSPAGLTLDGGTWVGDILEGNKVRFETRCSGGYEYSHDRSFLPLVDHAHDFNHPVHASYDVAGFAFTPCNREHEFPVRADQSYTGPAGGEIRAVLLSGADIDSRWVDGRVQHDDGRLFTWFACSERDFSFCPRYTVGTPNALHLDVRNANPAIAVAAQHGQVREGEAIRFVITRHWDHPALFDNAEPGDSAVRTRIAYRVTGSAAYVAEQHSGYREQDAFDLTVHEYTVEIPTLDDAMRRADGSVTLELLPDSFPHVNAGGTYELYESIRATVTIRDNEFDPVVSISDTAGEGSAGTAGFAVSLTGPSELDITVDWQIQEGSALPGDEHGELLASGTIALAPGETAQTVSVAISGLTGEPVRILKVTLSNAVNAVFSGGAATIEAELPIPGASMEVPAPVVAAVPDTAGNLRVSWQAPDGPPPAGYQVDYRKRGAPEWASARTAGEATDLPILFLERDTEYEARVRARHDAVQDGGRDSAAAAMSAWSASGFGRTGVHQAGSEPVVTLALVDSDPAVEGEPVLFHVLVSELRNSYQWDGFSAGIIVDLRYRWQRGGNVLPSSSRFGIVPGVFTVDHGLGGYRNYRVWPPVYAAEHGPLTVTVQPGDGYRVGEAASVCVSIADSETLEAIPCPDDDEPPATALQTSAAPVSIAVRDARATEGVHEVISFPVTLSAAASEAVTVDWTTADGTARAGEDYVAASGTLTFAAGKTERAIAVTVLDDAHDEGEETFALRLSGAVGAELADADATGTIVNSDPMPRAWLGRFGSMTWEHTLDAVDQRLRNAHASRTHAAIGGRSIAVAPADAGGSEEERLAALANWVAGRQDEPARHAVNGPGLLAGSEFRVSTAAPAPGSRGAKTLTVWGQGAYGSFAGADAGLSVGGDVASGTLGVDYAAGPWLAGLALSHSSGWGSYRRPDAPEGEVTSSLTGAYPYLGLDVVPERLTLWLAGGYGLGGMRLAPRGGAPLETGIGLLAGAAGLRGTLLPAVASGGLSLGVNADAAVLRATSEEAAGLAATTVDVNRLRLGLEGSYRVAVGSALLTPSLEVAVRRDGGGAETGYGIDLGGGLSYSDPGLGLSFGLRGHTLLLHEADGLAEWGAGGWLAWDPSPASELGPSLTVNPAVGARAHGGAAGLWSRATLAGPDLPAAPSANGRIDAKFGYGLPLAGGTGTPRVGFGLAEGERSYRLGYEVQVGAPAAAEMRVAFEAERRERDAAAAPEHTLALRSTVRW